MFSQDVQQVEVLKNDKQVTELFDEIGDSEIKLDVIDFLTQPALNIGYEIINDSYSSYGAEVFLNFNDNNLSRSWSEKFSLNLKTISSNCFKLFFFIKSEKSESTPPLSTIRSSLFLIRSSIKQCGSSSFLTSK